MKKDSTRRCINHISFTVLLGATLFVYIGSIGPYTSGILTTIQREFQFKSSEVRINLMMRQIPLNFFVSIFSSSYISQKLWGISDLLLLYVCV